MKSQVSDFDELTVVKELLVLITKPKWLKFYGHLNFTEIACFMEVCMEKIMTFIIIFYYYYYYSICYISQVDVTLGCHQGCIYQHPHNHR